MHRLRGEVLGALEPPDEAGAEVAFERSLAVARRQGARSWELRAAMSLGKLWRDRGDLDEARQVLDGVYRGFDQGFETPDLRDARALLDEWAAG